jgi:hypothetical protein
MGSVSESPEDLPTRRSVAVVLWLDTHVSEHLPCCHRRVNRCHRGTVRPPVSH